MMKRVDKHRIQARPEPVVFTHYDHDDLVLAGERIRTSAGLDPVSASAAAVGLKLLGAAMLSEKDNPLFDGLRDPLREFIVNLNALGARADES